MSSSMSGVVKALIEDISEGIRVLRTRDGVALTEEQIRERANNIVCGLRGNYAIQALVEPEARETD